MSRLYQRFFSGLLKRILPDVTDTFVIAGEWAARKSKYGEAAEAFIQAESLSLPRFSAGMTYMSDRLRLFSRLESPEAREAAAIQGLSGNLIAQSHDAVSRLDPFAVSCEFQGPATLYPGINPYCPSSKVLPLSEFESVTG